MRSQRGSATILAITTMLILAVGAASLAYTTRRNIDITQTYIDGLQAQYTAEAAVRLMYVAGRESITPKNGWTSGKSSLLDQIVAAGGSCKNMALPGGRPADVTVAKTNSTYNVQAEAKSGSVSRLAYNDKLDIFNFMVDEITSSTTASLIAHGKTWLSTNTVGWQLPEDVNDTTVASYSPGFGTSNELTVASQVLFDDALGLSSYRASSSLQLIFRVNYYIKLVSVPNSASSGSGYGVYYLANKAYDSSTQIWNPGNPGDPTAYIVQFDPGLHPGYASPPGGTAWGAAYTGNPKDSNWPYGAFLVKKAWSDGGNGWQNEVWDEDGSYNDHCGFQDNNELTQRYYNSSGSIRPNLTAANLIKTSNSSDWALQPASLTPGLSAPSVTLVPTAFGYSRDGTFTTEKTGKYRERPPDLRIPYTLGQIAEGNPWKSGTYYRIGDRVAVGIWVDNPVDSRMVWEATKAGVSSSSKPSALARQQVTGATVTDGGVIWTAKKAPTSEEIANTILNYGISIAKISMADLKYRLDSVTGTSAYSNPYSVPFHMVTKNKITVEFWGDNLGNRIHLIKVNDVLVLAFNDRYDSSKHNIVPQRWETNPTVVKLGTGLRIWNAGAEFYTVDNYGQTVKAMGNYGVWHQ